ncbi:MAG: ATP-binding cassette domain-containing protein [Anaerolineae bacterium]|nr:MAG: ATP-binding cassette domain-containing protein [Anaerolineae bacterium]
MNAIEVSGVSKSFGDTKAVVDVSFEVASGEIFGLLGPNGAGKTTTIRLILDIFKPDRGSISVLGGEMSEETKDRIGYMPEERGLYQDVSLERCLIYLARLKGVPAGEAKSRLQDYLDRFDLAQHRQKKVKELSKGMQQKAQIIATILHRPDLVIIDEPFTSLDPINTQMVKDLIRDLQRDGATILMSTHQMHQVEQMCDRILLINQGRNLLYGRLDAIRRQYAGEEVLVRTVEDLPILKGVESSVTVNGSARLTLGPGESPQSVLRRLMEYDLTLEKFEIAMPSLAEIFIRAVREGQNG